MAVVEVVAEGDQQGQLVEVVVVEEDQLGQLVEVVQVVIVKTPTVQVV